MLARISIVLKTCMRGWIVSPLAAVHRDRNRGVGRSIEGELRELVISFGRTGYIALYRFLPAADDVRILASRHQRELDYP